MKILIINTSDTAGGAAQVGWTLAKGLRARAHLVDMLVGTKCSSSPDVRELPRPLEENYRSLSDRIIHRLGVNALRLDSTIPRSLGPRQFNSYDIIHIHDMPGFNWAHLPWLSRQSNLIWSLHCMEPLTGNCIYSYGCERFLKNCGSCPQYGNWPLAWLHRDGSFLNMHLKRVIAGVMSVRIIGVSEWITNQARASVFSRFPLTTITNAVEPGRFFPVDRVAARARLGIPVDARTVMLSVSCNVLDKRKGLDLALDAIRKLKDLDLFLLPTGISGDPVALKKAMSGAVGLEPRNITDDSILRDYYAAADVLWHPSRADNYPMALLEAAACGTPVIASGVGGVPEIVTPQRGIIIPPNDSHALAMATRQFFTSASGNTLQQPRSPSIDSFAEYNRFLDAHENLYRKCLG